jgi:hypothetical protein
MDSHPLQTVPITDLSIGLSPAARINRGRSYINLVLLIVTPLSITSNNIYSRLLIFTLLLLL